MAATRQQGKPAAKAAARSHGGSVAVATVMAFLCLCLSGCGEVLDEDGAPPEARDTLVSCAFFWGFPLVLSLLIGLVRATGIVELSEDVHHMVNHVWLLSWGLSHVLLVVFFIIMAPRWYISLQCDPGKASHSCSGHGTMYCNKDWLGAADHPECYCDYGWKGPTCAIGTTMTQTTTSTTSATQTTTSATSTTGTLSTTTNTSFTSTSTTTTTTTTTLLCPGGSNPRLGVDIILDPSTDCTGVSLGVAWMPGAIIGAVATAVPVLVVLCISLRQRLMTKEIIGKLIFDVIVASLDVGSDLFWLLTGDFYGIETLIPAVVFLVSPSLLFTLWFFGRKTLIRPRSWAKSLSQVVATSFEEAVKALASLCEMLRDHCRKRFRPYCGCFQYAPELEGELHFACMNIVFWVGAVLLAALGLITIFCSALFFLISGILLCACLSLTWLIASVLWCATQTLVVMALHVTRLASLRPIHIHVLRMLDSPTSAAADPGAASPSAPTSDDATAWIDPEMWHATLLVEAGLESFPCFAINVADMVLLNLVGLDSLSVQAGLAAGTSFFVILRILFRYFYWCIYKKKQLKDVRIVYQTRRDAAGAAAGAVGSAAG